MRRVALALVVLALAPLARAGAQRPAERAALDSIRAGYQAETDTLLLIRREQERIAVARVNRDSALLHMELGYLAFRLGELTQQHQRYDDAAGEFQWASDLKPDWPYAWYQLGLAELAQGESRIALIENIRQILGLDFLTRAARAFERAVAADPTFARAIVDLANTALRQRIKPRLEITRALLRQVAGGPAGRLAEVQLMRGRIEQRLGAPDSALAAYLSYLALGGDSGLGALEVARAEALLEQRDSSRVWFARALARPPDDSLRHALRRDLHWIAEPQELAAFDAAPAESVATLVRRFWERRDAADGRRPGERLVEQFRRYQYAQENFALASRRRRHDVTFAFVDTTQSDFDDRGVVYLRHGEPAERANYQAPGFDANESWLYHLGGTTGDVVVHFVAYGDVSDFRLVESLLAACRISAGYVEPLLRSNLTMGRTITDQAARANTRTGDVNQCVLSRASLSPMYQRLAGVGAVGSVNLWETERQTSRAMVHATVTSDSYVHQYAASLRPVASWFAVADETFRPQVHLVFAVSATRLHPVAAGEGVAYPLNLRLFVTDSATGAMVAALDTLRVFHSAARLAGDAFLTEQLALRVPPGRHRYTFVIEEPQAGSGDAVTRQVMDVPAMDAGFAASDVVLGREGSGLVWRRPGGDVPLNPLGRYPRDAEATIYYELYGLPAGAGVATRVRVIPVGGRSLLQRLLGRGGGADLSYRTVTGAAGRSVVSQRIGLMGLKPGRYTLQVELTDEAGGAHIVRTSPFEIGGGSAP